MAELTLPKKNGSGSKRHRNDALHILCFHLHQYIHFRRPPGAG